MTIIGQQLCTFVSCVGCPRLMYQCNLLSFFLLLSHNVLISMGLCINDLKYYYQIFHTGHLPTTCNVMHFTLNWSWLWWQQWPWLHFLLGCRNSGTWCGVKLHQQGEHDGTAGWNESLANTQNLLIQQRYWSDCSHQVLLIHPDSLQRAAFLNDNKDFWTCRKKKTKNKKLFFT